MKKAVNIFWFRRDLRLEDNHGLYLALTQNTPVLPIFIFDTNILNLLGDSSDPRVSFIHETLQDLNQKLKQFDSGLQVFHGAPLTIFEQLVDTYNIGTIFLNKDYEPYATERDLKIKSFCDSNGISTRAVKDHVIFEEQEIVKNDGNPYTVFTPYSKKWKAAFKPISFPSEKFLMNCLKIDNEPIIDLIDLGFQKTPIPIPSKTIAQSLIKNYDNTRNYPGINGTSRLGIHFRFGTISIREKANKALQLNETYLNELIWRDFYSMILFNFPHVEKNAFRKPYDSIAWRNEEADFLKWKNGFTGYPIVDAGMRELNTTGYMHNRVRMITASFLTKHLLIDWRWGERYFAEKLLDFDLASNNGGWQWAAGSGTDAAPYFRIFNPKSQQEKFDADFTYIAKWIPEWDTAKYPDPMIDHKIARERCLEVYKAGLELGKV